MSEEVKSHYSSTISKLERTADTETWKLNSDIDPAIPRYARLIIGKFFRSWPLNRYHHQIVQDLAGETVAGVSFIHERAENPRSQSTVDIASMWVVTLTPRMLHKCWPCDRLAWYVCPNSSANNRFLWASTMFTAQRTNHTRTIFGW